MKEEGRKGCSPNKWKDVGGGPGRWAYGWIEHSPVIQSVTSLAPFPKSNISITCFPAVMLIVYRAIPSSPVTLFDVLFSRSSTPSGVYTRTLGGSGLRASLVLVAVGVVEEEDVVVVDVVEVAEVELVEALYHTVKSEHWAGFSRSENILSVGRDARHVVFPPDVLAPIVINALTLLSGFPSWSVKLARKRVCAG